MVATALTQQATPASRRSVTRFGSPRRSSFVPMMVTALAATVVVLVICVAVAAAFGPEGAVLAVSVGVVLAAQFFAFGSLALRLLMFGPNDGGLVLGALAIYSIQVLTLLGALLVVPTDTIPAPHWFAVAAALETVVWQAGMGAALLGTRVFAFTPGESAASQDRQEDRA